MSMNHLPSYLLATAYGERAKFVATHKASPHGSDCILESDVIQQSKVNGNSTSSVRIYNKRASSKRSVVGNGSANGSANGNHKVTGDEGKSTESLLSVQEPPIRRQWHRGTELSYPSTVPIFRDDGLNLRTSWSLPRLIPAPNSASSPRSMDEMDEDSDDFEEEEDEDDEEEDDEEEDDDLYDEEIKPANEIIAALRVQYHVKALEQKDAMINPSHQTLPQLPNKFTKKDTEHAVKLSKGGRVIEYVTEGKPAIQEVRVLRSNHPVPSLCGIFYYEVEVVSCTRDPMISIGFCTEDSKLVKLPGMDSNSWGYHSDDGRTMSCQSLNSTGGPGFGLGDIVGCGFDFTNNCIFYTKNGIELSPTTVNLTRLTTARGNSRAKHYPCIGFKPTVSLRTNFGEDEFHYDIDQYVQRRKSSVLKNIKSSDMLPQTDSAVGLKEDEIPGMIQSLITSYFSYLGYIDSATAFKNEVRKEGLLSDQPDEVMKEGEEVVDEDESTNAKHRQTIRQLILNGRIEKVIEVLGEYYPLVLEEKNSLVVFQLECCKFIELVKSVLQTAENTDLIDTDVDETFEVVEYGRVLWEKYKNDQRPGVVERLTQCFSLLAYDRSTQDETLSQLLNENVRFALAEDVNSRILVSLGKQPVPPLKRVAQHAMGLIWELQNQGRVEADVLNIRQDFL